MANVFKVLQGAVKDGNTLKPPGARFRAGKNDMRDLVAAGLVAFHHGTYRKPIRRRDVWQRDNLLTMPATRLRALHFNRRFAVRVNRYFPELTLEAMRGMTKQVMDYVILERHKRSKPCPTQPSRT